MISANYWPIPFSVSLPKALDRTCARRILLKRNVSSHLIIIGRIFREIFAEAVHQAQYPQRQARNAFRARGEHVTLEIIGKTRCLAANEMRRVAPTYDVLEAVGGSKKPPMVLISGQNISAGYRSANSARSDARLRGRSSPPAHDHRHFGKSHISVRGPPAMRGRIRSYFLINELLMVMR
jgi:hypothetical protein